jgi:hypothetical protein
MPQVRTAYLRLVDPEQPPPPPRLPKVRFRPVIRLDDGAAVGIDAETDHEFEDGARFGVQPASGATSAAVFLSAVVERAGGLASARSGDVRPISVRAPLAALVDPDMPMALEAAARRSGLLPQEVRIDFPDATVSSLEDQAFFLLERLARRGFRTGLDARTSWRTPMCARARACFETVRLRMDPHDVNPFPASRIEAARADGMEFVIEGAAWRDADRLSAIGVRHAIAPKADA